MVKKTTKNDAATSKSSNKVKKNKTNEKKKEKQPEKKLEEVTPPAPVAEPVTEQASQQVNEEDTGSENLLSEITQSIQLAYSSQKSLLNNIKSFNKSYKKEIKDLKKLQRKSKRGNKKDPHRQKRAPSGFAVPSKISSEMCQFLGIPSGTQLSRTDVTRKLTAYIRQQNLQVPTNRRSFIPDNQLGSILGPLKPMDVDKGYTYFNLQRYITPHIVSNSSSSSS